MGSCCSCLGWGSGDGDDERAPLLNDNYRAQYGSHGPHANRPVYQPDLEFLRREREALDSICHNMSDNIIDVFTIQPPPPNGNMTPRPDTPSTDSLPPHTGDLSAEEMRMRTIKKGRNPVYSSLGQVGQGWRAVQDAIG